MESVLSVVLVILSFVILQLVVAGNIDPNGKANWYPLRQGDYTYIVVLYKPQQRTDTPVDATLGQACGGLLVTTNKVLTQCACMRSFFHAHDDIPPRAEKVPPDPKSPQDIGSKDIYVTLWPVNAEFIADQKHVLDQNPLNFMKKSICYNDMKAVAEGAKNVKILQASIVVVLFSPEITDMTPAEISSASADYTEPFIFAFGMSNKNPAEVILDPDSKSMFDPTTRTVEYEFNFLNFSCPYTDYCKKQIFDGKIPKDYSETAKCLCKKQQRIVQLCKGVPGFPLTLYDEPVGVMASPVDCDTGSVMVNLFDQATLLEIEAFEKQVFVNVTITTTDAASTMTTSTPPTEEPTTPPWVPKIPTTGFSRPPFKPDKANLLNASNTILFPLLFSRYLY